MWIPAAVLVALSCTLAGAQEETPESTARRAADRNRAAIEAIRTVSCRYARVIQPQVHRDEIYNDAENYQGRYWRTPETIRVSQRFSPQAGAERLVRQGREWSLTISPGKKGEVRLLAVGRHVSLARGDVWYCVLFSHFAGGELMQALPFSEMLDHPHQIDSARKVTEGGRNLIYVKCTGLEAQREFWFDPAVNYLVRKSTFVPDADKSFRRESEVLEFVEPTPGIFFPSLIEERAQKGERPYAVIRTTISDLVVNRGLSESDLRLPNINGMMCTDVDRRTDYRVDADGNRIGPEKPTETLFGTAGDVQSGSRPIPPSKPPWPLWLWILLLSLACLAAAMGVRYLRNRASRLASTTDGGGS